MVNKTNHTKGGNHHATITKQELKRLGAVIAVATSLGTLGNLLIRNERQQLESMQIKDMTGKQFARLQLLTK